MNRITKTMIISLLLVIVLPMAKLSAQVSVWDGTWEPWTHGTGTEADPFLIENAQQLAYLAYGVNNGSVDSYNHFKLMIDINLNGSLNGSENLHWIPIGHKNRPFYGFFDGNHHSISGLVIKNAMLNNSYLQHIGFIGYAVGAVVENLNVGGEINCSYSYLDWIEINVFYAGGIVGYSKGMTRINNCNNNCDVSLLVESESGNYSYFRWSDWLLRW